MDVKTSIFTCIGDVLLKVHDATTPYIEEVMQIVCLGYQGCLHMKNGDVETY